MMKPPKSPTKRLSAQAPSLTASSTNKPKVHTPSLSAVHASSRLFPSSLGMPLMAILQHLASSPFMALMGTLRDYRSSKEFSKSHSSSKTNKPHANRQAPHSNQPQPPPPISNQSKDTRLPPTEANPKETPTHLDKNLTSANEPPSSTLGNEPPNDTFGTAEEHSANTQAQRQLSEAKQHAEAENDIRRLFMHSLHHDIATPINGIINISKLLQQNVEEIKNTETKSEKEMLQFKKNSEELSHGLRIVKESGERIIDIFEQVIDLFVRKSSVLDHDKKWQAFTLDELSAAITKMTTSLSQNNLIRICTSEKSTTRPNTTHSHSVGRNENLYVADKRLLTQTLVYTLIHICRMDYRGIIELKMKAEDEKLSFTLQAELISETLSSKNGATRPSFFPKYIDSAMPAALTILLKDNISQLQGQAHFKYQDKKILISFIVPRSFKTNNGGFLDLVKVPTPQSTFVQPEDTSNNATATNTTATSKVDTMTQKKMAVNHEDEAHTMAKSKIATNNENKKQTEGEINTQVENPLLHFPAEESLSTQNTHTSPNKAGQPDQSNNSILIIDDEEIGRETARLILSGLRKQPILFAATGHEAKILFERHRHEIIGVFMDMHLPDTEKFELFDAFHACDPSKPIIALTGEDDEAFIRSAFDRGFFDYLGKPYTPGELIEKCEAFLLHQASKKNSLSF